MTAGFTLSSQSKASTCIWPAITDTLQASHIQYLKYFRLRTMFFILLLNVPFSLFSSVAPSDNYIHSKTFEGMSALHLSARCGSLECVGVLLEAGVDPDQVTTESNTALFLGGAFLKSQSDCYMGEAVLYSRVHAFVA